jgi:hypothetical protein
MILKTYFVGHDRVIVTKNLVITTHGAPKHDAESAMSKIATKFQLMNEHKAKSVFGGVNAEEYNIDIRKRR